MDGNRPHNAYRIDITLDKAIGMLVCTLDHLPYNGVAAHALCSLEDLAIPWGMDTDGNVVLLPEKSCDIE